MKGKPRTILIIMLYNIQMADSANILSGNSELSDHACVVPVRIEEGYHTHEQYTRHERSS